MMDCIIAEVVSHQPSEIKDHLLSTSILDRFCAPLCEAVCLVTNDSDKARKVVCAASNQTAGGTYTARLLLSLCFIDWLEGDLIGLRQNATQLP